MAGGWLATSWRCCARSGRKVLLADAFDCGQGRRACDADAYARDVADAFHALYQEVSAQ